MNPSTIPLSRLQLKVMLCHSDLPETPWEILEISKNTLVLRTPVSLTQKAPAITLWMRALGKDAWHPFRLKELTPMGSGANGHTHFKFSVDQLADFFRCFDFSRLHR